MSVFFKFNLRSLEVNNLFVIKSCFTDAYSSLSNENKDYVIDLGNKDLGLSMGLSNIS
jgi:hypothetical protein